MPHIHTQDGQHDLTVSAYIFRTDFARPKLLLHKHKKLNTLLQFGGHVELEEDIWAALEHELTEETGYKMSQLQVLQPKDRIKQLSGRSVLHYQPAYINTHPIDTGDLEGKKHYHIDIGYVFVAEAEPEGQVAEGESTNLKLLDRKQLLGLKDDVIWPDTKQICLYMFDNCLDNWERVSL